jgi:hypothetical protein
MILRQNITNHFLKDKFQSTMPQTDRIDMVAVLPGEEKQEWPWINIVMDCT